ncbi:MAG: hypothetical protein GY771_11745 [bacterium]|nr:hypothetical protein [bacterium]
METRYIVPIVSLTLILSANLLSCGGTDDKKTEPPALEAIESEAPHTSRGEAGEHPGEFTLDDTDIKLLSREPSFGDQVITFVYTGPYFSKVRTTKIMNELAPGITYNSGKRLDPVGWEAVSEIGYHETEGEVFIADYPGGSGACALTVNTVNGRSTIELGDAATTYRYAEKVRSGIKVNMRSGPSIEKSIIRVLEPGDMVLPTGDLELEVVVKDEDDDGEWFLFQKVTTPLGEDGWVIKDDEVFEYAGYIDASGG